MKINLTIAQLARLRPLLVAEDIRLNGYSIDIDSQQADSLYKRLSKTGAQTSTREFVTINAIIDKLLVVKRSAQGKEHR